MADEKDKNKDEKDLPKEPKFSLAENLIIENLEVGKPTSNSIASDADPVVEQGLAMARHMQAMIVEKLELAAIGSHPLVNQGMQTAKQIVTNIFNEKSDEEVPPEPVPEPAPVEDTLPIEIVPGAVVPLATTTPATASSTPIISGQSDDYVEATTTPVVSNQSDDYSEATTTPAVSNQSDDYVEVITTDKTSKQSDDYATGN